MDSFVEELLDRINCATVLEFPVGDITITFKESVVISWGIIVVVALLSFLLTRHLSVDKPGKAQLLLESVLTAWADGARVLQNPLLLWCRSTSWRYSFVRFLFVCGCSATLPAAL